MTVATTVNAHGAMFLAAAPEIAEHGPSLPNGLGPQIKLIVASIVGGVIAGIHGWRVVKPLIASLRRELKSDTDTRPVKEIVVSGERQAIDNSAQIAALRRDVDSLKDDFGGLKQDLRSASGQMEGVRDDVRGVMDDVREIRKALRPKRDE